MMDSSALEDRVAAVLVGHVRTILKSIMIGVMVAFSLSIFAVSVGRILVIVTISMAAALFHTWRRWLETLSLAIFCVAVAAICAPELAADLRSAVQRVMSANAAR